MGLTILNQRPVEHVPTLKIVSERRVGDPKDIEPEFSDYARQGMATFASMGAGLGWVGQKLGEKTGINFLERGGIALKQAGRNARDTWINERLETFGITQEGLSENARRAMEVEFLGDSSYKEKWQKAKLLALGSLPATMGGLGVGGILAKGLATAGVGPGISAAVGYGLGEAGIAAPMAGEAVDDQLSRMSHEELLESPEYRASYDAFSGSEQERQDKAKQLISAAAAGNAAAWTMLSTFMLSAPAGFILQKFLPGGVPAPSGRISGFAKGATTEAVQELFQSGTEQLSQNLAMKEAGFDGDIWNDVLEEAVGGALSGATIGGPLGAAAPGGTPETATVPGEEPPEAAIPAESVLGEEAEPEEQAFRYQLMKNQNGASPQIEVVPLTQERFLKYIRPYIDEGAPGYAKTLEEYQQKYPDNTHISLFRGRSDQDWKPNTTGTVEKLTRFEGDIGRKLRAVESFDSKEAAEWAALDSQNLSRKDKGAIDASKDSILVAISKLGGLNSQIAESEGIDPADFSARGKGIKRVFTKGGRSPDELAEILAEHGYPVVDQEGAYTGNKLIERVQEALGFDGEGGTAPQGTEARLEAEAVDRDASEVERAAEQDPDYNEVTAQLAEVAFERVPEYEELSDDQTRSLADLAMLAREHADEETVQDALMASSDNAAARELWTIINEGKTDAAPETRAEPAPRSEPPAEKVSEPAAEKGKEKPATKEVKTSEPEREKAAEGSGKSSESGSEAGTKREKSPETTGTKKEPAAEPEPVSGATIAKELAGADADTVASLPRTENPMEVLATAEKILIDDGYVEIPYGKSTIFVNPKKKTTAFGRSQGTGAGPLVQFGEATDEQVAEASVAPKKEDRPSQKEIDLGAHEAATSQKNEMPQPTQAQKEAGGEGNYKLGDPVKLYGVTWRVENPKGSYRYKLDESVLKEIKDLNIDPLSRQAGVLLAELKDGVIQPAFRRLRTMQSMAEGIAKKKIGKLITDSWFNKMPAHYSRALEVEGADGDKLDAFIGPKAADQTLPVYVVDTYTLSDGSFDEHKVLIGFESLAKAFSTLRASYDADVFKKIVPRSKQNVKKFSPEEFAEFIASDKARMAPVRAGTTKKKKPARVVGPKPVQKIEDFGEKIGGARKDLWGGFLGKLDTDLPPPAQIVMSKHFPVPNYEKLAADGVPAKDLAMIKAMRDIIPNKPRRAWQLKSWGQKVETIRDFAKDIIEGKFTADFVADKLVETGDRGLVDVKNVMDLYLAAGFPDKSIDLKGVRLRSASYSMLKEQRFDPAKTFWTIERKSKGSSFSNWPRVLGDYYESRDDLMKAAPSVFEAMTPKKGGKKERGKTKLDIYRETRTGKIWIGKKVAAGKYIDLKEFPKGRKGSLEARKYLSENLDDLLTLLEKKKHIPPMRRSVNDPRIGVDHRKGKDVSPELFQDTFGFRGVEFGNWVEQGKRQADLNNAYDGLLDLAAIINVPPRALALSGRLGLAFGARGKGGANPAAAHFESGKVVINLTKKGGAGSLAHEWWHALDNYFGKQRKGAPLFLTEEPTKRRVRNKAGELVDDISVRPEVLLTYKDLVDAIESSEMLTRSGELDKRRTKKYWNTRIEMTARAFERYVIDKAKAKDERSDYLANIVPEEAFDDVYPYPTDAEAKVFEKEYDKIFETLETQENEEGNVVLFSLDDKKKVKGLGVRRVKLHADSITGKWKNLPAELVVTTRARMHDVPDALQDKITAMDTRGAAKGANEKNGSRVFLFADNLSSLAEVERVIIHEIKGHFGTQKFLGDGYKPFTEKVFLTFPELAVQEARHIRADLRKTDDRMRVADEVVARIAERIEAKTAIAKMIKLWDQFYSLFIRALRSLGLTNYKPTRSELRDVVRQASRFVESGVAKPLPTMRLAKITDANFSASVLKHDLDPDAAVARAKANENIDSVLNYSSDPDNQIELARLRDDEIQKRERTFVESLKEGQLLDRAFRKPFLLFGTINDKGTFEISPKAKRFASRSVDGVRAFMGSKRFSWLHHIGGIAHRNLIEAYGINDKWTQAVEKTKHGLIDRYGLPEEFKKRDFRRQADERALLLQAQDVLKNLMDEGVGAKESEVLYRMLTGQKVTDKHMAKLAPPVQQAIDQMGQEAVDLGLITAESYERNRGAYLTRSYKIHEAKKTPLGKMASDLMATRRRKIIGNQFKGRGIFLRKEQGKVLARIPEDWWGRRKEKKGADKSLKGEKFVVLDRIQAPGLGTPDLPGMDKGKVDRKVTDRVYWPAGLDVPSIWSGYENRGEFEVRDVVKGELVLWRDFTEEERSRMGEITDARYAIAKTYLQMAHDLSTGRFFQDIASNQDWASKNDPGVSSPDGTESRLHLQTDNDWVRVPDTKIKGSKTAKYGALAGMYVRSEIWKDMVELQRMQNHGFWRKVMTQWKLNKTARNPVVHFNNIMANIMLMDMVDVRAQDFVRGLRSFIDEDAYFKDALQHGAFGADIISQEIRQNVLAPILAKIDSEQVAEKGTGVWGVMMRLGTMIRNADMKMMDVYRMEDEIFRMATYRRQIALGYTPEDAAMHAREQFLNYDIRAPWINALRETVLPFIAYTYRAVPIVASSLASRPWKLAKYSTVAYMVNALSYMLTGDPEDEEAERATMREGERGRTWLGVYRMLRTPLRDRWGNPIFLDVRRWIPAGDVFDLHQGSSALPIPAPLQFGGPLMIASELMLNRAAFTGRDIVNDLTDTPGEKAANWGNFLWKSFAPSAPWIPGSWYQEKIIGAITGNLDPMMREYSVPLAISSSLGLKLKPHDVDLNRRYLMMYYDSVERALNQQLQALSRDVARNRIDQKYFNERVADIREKQMRVGEQKRALIP